MRFLGGMHDNGRAILAFVVVSVGVSDEVLQIFGLVVVSNVRKRVVILLVLGMLGLVLTMHLLGNNFLFLFGGRVCWHGVGNCVMRRSVGSSMAVVNLFCMSMSIQFSINVMVKVHVNLARIVMFGVVFFGVVIQNVMFERFHFEDEISSGSVHIGGVEDGGVGLEAAASLVPATRVKGVEIVAPVELKLVCVLVVREHLNVVVKGEPGHVNWVKAVSPRVESGRPEVHSEGLSLVHELGGFV